MPADDETPAWYDRFFQHEYLTFDEHPESAQEVDFLLETLRLPEEALLLDLCCGYGRHAIPLAGKGLRVVGLDKSPVMLQQARMSAAPLPPALQFIRGDMARLPMSNAFDAVISLFSSFGYFENDDDNFRVLREIAGVLKPGGSFFIETANREFVVRHFNPVQVYHPQGNLLIEERAFDVVTGRSHVDVTLVQNGRETHLHHSIRLYTVPELQVLLEAVGLYADDVWGDYDGGDFTWDSPQLILHARRAG